MFILCFCIVRSRRRRKGLKFPIIDDDGDDDSSSPSMVAALMVRLTLCRSKRSRKAEAELERIGVGVTSEAQSLFDVLSKTLPVRWDKTSIVVMNEVRVTSPYHPECVVGGTPVANERVRKVLEFEKKRLQTRGTSQF